MKKILYLLNFDQKKNLLFVIFAVIILSLIEICVFSFIPIILNYFSESNQNLNQFFLIDFFLKKNLNINYIFILFIIIFTFRSLFSILITYKKNKITKSVNDDLSDIIYKNYLNRDYSFFLKKNSSEFITIIIIEIEKFSYRIIDSIII